MTSVCAHGRGLDRLVLDSSLGCPSHRPPTTSLLAILRGVLQTERARIEEGVRPNDEGTIALTAIFKVCLSDTAPPGPDQNMRAGIPNIQKISTISPFFFHN